MVYHSVGAASGPINADDNSRFAAVVGLRKRTSWLAIREVYHDVVEWLTRLVIVPLDELATCVDHLLVLVQRPSPANVQQAVLVTFCA